MKFGEEIIYSPIVKTTESEINAIRNLDQRVKERILPVFELTRGRKHKQYFPEGDINKSLRFIEEIFPHGDFILDITQHDDLINSDLESLINSDDGYASWVNFVSRLEFVDRLLPVLQIDGDELEKDESTALENIAKQSSSLSEITGAVVARLPWDLYENDVENILSAIFRRVEKSNVIVIVDYGYIKPFTGSGYVEDTLPLLKKVSGLCERGNIIVCASSFPKIVTAPNYGQEHYGKFQLEETVLYNEVVRNLGSGFVYSDYGSIHPIRYDVKGGSWIPRVDVPLASEVYYYRYRRQNEGGYIRCAKEAARDDDFEKCVTCWGKEKILEAAKGKPEKWNPAFWISVRSNIHVTTQCDIRYLQG